MTDPHALPATMYLAGALNPLESMEAIAPQLSELEHLCLDDNPLAELLLRLTIAKHGILPSQAPKLFGYKALKGGNPVYFFVNEIQHNYLQNSLDNPGEACEVKD